MFSSLAIAVFKSVLHTLEDKNWDDVAYLRKHGKVHQVERHEHHVICFFADQLRLEIVATHRTLQFSHG